MNRVPFLIVGDGPDQPTGLSRILTDIAAQLYAVQDALNLDVRTCGWYPWQAMPAQGTEIQMTDSTVPFRTWAFTSFPALLSAVTTCYRSWWGDRPGILFTIWDAHRCFPLLDLTLPVRRWGYVPVDAKNINGTFGGPAADAIRMYDRLLAYTTFGEEAIRAIPGKKYGTIDHLPHGINRSVFHNRITDTEIEATRQTLGSRADGRTIVGCVATNQPRKDLGLYCRVLRALIDRDERWYGWLHVDREVSDAWSIPQLAEDLALHEFLTVTTRLTDRELACGYSRCAVTVAPGRGEGFGYPIVESQACGVPAIHCRYAGGAEFIQYTDALIEPYIFTLDGPYALLRPILHVDDVVNRVLRIAGPEGVDRWNVDALQETIAYLDWPALWPAWRTWIEEGL